MSLKCRPQTELVSRRPVDKRDHFCQHSQPSYSAIWDGFKDRETFLLHPHDFIQLLCFNTLIIEHISSTHTVLFSQKQEEEKVQRRWIFSTDQIPPAQGGIGLASRWGTAVWRAGCVFSAEWAGRFAFGNFILCSAWRETKLKKQIHQVRAKYSTFNIVYSN